MRLPAIFAIYIFRKIETVNCCQSKWVFIIVKCFTNAIIWNILVLRLRKR